ncbi:ParA family protein [Hyphomicrobium facile]|uniref:Chromosome partitioning protein n=1 Tax=Hyphomicrobium facile TaxID=51670 RepID=A0A1I7NW17_9HYPH|nr:ParA family protein [Hyphomicrobium facile]SFV38778.1 chromosome partitioning protein [Hyphomicrobium facile]
MPLIVSFVSQKGGVGKSTLARALAAVGATGKLKVKLADLDIQQQTSVRWGKARKQRGTASPIDVGAFRSFDDALADSEAFDLIIVDTPGHTSPSTGTVARASHMVVVPTSATIDDLYPTVLLLRALEEIGIPQSRLAVALCRVLEPSEEKVARNYVAAAGYELLPGFIPERASYRNAQNRGQALTETIDGTENESADALIESLLRKIAGQSDRTRNWSGD